MVRQHNRGIVAEVEHPDVVNGIARRPGFSCFLLLRQHGHTLSLAPIRSAVDDRKLVPRAQRLVCGIGMPFVILGVVPGVENALVYFRCGRIGNGVAWIVAISSARRERHMRTDGSLYIVENFPAVGTFHPNSQETGICIDAVNVADVSVIVSMNVGGARSGGGRRRKLLHHLRARKRLALRVGEFKMLVEQLPNGMLIPAHQSLREGVVCADDRTGILGRLRRRGRLGIKEDGQ